VSRRHFGRATLANHQLRSHARAKRKFQSTEKQKPTMKSKIFIAAVFFILAMTPVFSQETNNFVTREQYEKLLAEHQKLLKEMEEMKLFKMQVQEMMTKNAPQKAETDLALDELEKKVDEVNRK